MARHGVRSAVSCFSANSCARPPNPHVLGARLWPLTWLIGACVDDRKRISTTTHAQSIASCCQDILVFLRISPPPRFRSCLIYLVRRVGRCLLSEDVLRHVVFHLFYCWSIFYEIPSHKPTAGLVPFPLPDKPLLSVWPSLTKLCVKVAEDKWFAGDCLEHGNCSQHNELSPNLFGHSSYTWEYFGALRRMDALALCPVKNGLHTFAWFGRTANCSPSSVPAVHGRSLLNPFYKFQIHQAETLRVLYIKSEQ